MKSNRVQRRTTAAEKHTGTEKVFTTEDEEEEKEDACVAKFCILMRFLLMSFQSFGSFIIYSDF